MPVVRRSRVCFGHVKVIGECQCEWQRYRLVWFPVRRYAPRLLKLLYVEDAFKSRPRVESRQAQSSAEERIKSESLQLLRLRDFLPARGSLRENQATK